MAFISLTIKAYTTVDGFDGETWYDHRATDFGGGSGLEDAPWLINSPEQLALLAWQVNEQGYDYSGGYFKLNADLSLNSYVWVPIGIRKSNDVFKCFKGTIINPDKHLVTGMNIKANGTGYTRSFGLFGVSQGVIDGIIIKQANLNIECTAAYESGTLCGYVGSISGSPGKSGQIKNCRVSESYVNATSGKGIYTDVGGVIGLVYTNDTIRNCVITDSQLQFTNVKCGGGVSGVIYEGISDCHAFVDILSDYTASNDNDYCYIGGIAGEFYAQGYQKTMSHCSSAGEIVSKDTNSNIGGLLGYCWIVHQSYPYYALMLCSTAMTLQGCRNIGGLIGNILFNANAQTAIYECFSCSFIDATNAKNAGGLIGYVNEKNRAQVNNTYVVDQCMFAGTMLPSTKNSHYGVMYGNREYVSGNSKYFAKNTKYDRLLCNLKTNGPGTSNIGTVESFTTPPPATEHETATSLYWAMKPVYEYNERHPLDKMKYTQIFELCSYPFFVTNDNKTLYSAEDVTAPFSLASTKNNWTQETLTYNFIVMDGSTGVSVSSGDNPIVTPFDPGEAIIEVRHKDVTRKVHLYINYGKDWDGTTTTTAGPASNVFDGGSGTQKDPYIIHNVVQLAGAIGSSDYNASGKYFRLANDLFINTHLLQGNGEPREDAMLWTPQDWKAHLDGAGHTIYGLCVKISSGRDNIVGMFSTMKENSSVSNLAIVDSYVANSPDGSSACCTGLLCGVMESNTSVDCCLLQGRVVGNGYTGAVCGRTGYWYLGTTESHDINIVDCFADVYTGHHPGYTYYMGSAFVGWDLGVCKLTRCLSIGRIDRVKRNDITPDPVLGTNCQSSDCYFDQQQLGFDGSNDTGAHLTCQLTGSQVLNNASAWLCQENRYPILRQFANTNPGKLISMPVTFYAGTDKIDRAGNVTEIFEFLCEDKAQWKALNGDSYIDVINECEAASLNGKSPDDHEMLIGELTGTASLCTSIKRIIPLDINVTGKVGIRFADSNIEQACLAAFDNNPQDEMITLREAFTSNAEGNDGWPAFNSHPSAKEGVTFNELRYFAGITNLPSGYISGLGNLGEVQMPKQLRTISSGAFNGCRSLKSVTLPLPFKATSPGAFYNSGIKNILVNPKNETLESRQGMLFTLDDELMAYPPARGKDTATVSGSLSTILEGAFYKVPGLTKIYLDNPLPEGEMAVLEENGIVPCDGNPLVDIYINDGSTNGVISDNQLFGMPELYTAYLYDDAWRTYDPVGSHLHRYYPLTVTSAGWATLYIGFATQLPEGLSPYVVSVKDLENNEVTLKRINTLLPRETPVVIKAGNAGRYLLYPFTDHEVPQIEKSRNQLIGTFIGQDSNGDGLPEYGVPVTQGDSNEGSVLTLGRNADGEVGFFYYKVDGQIPPYKAYLTVNTVTDETSSSRGFSVTIDNTIDDQSNGIADVSNITIDAMFYDLQGRTIIGKPAKSGIYIRNGRKFMVK